MESPVVTSAEMRASEEAAFARGVSAEALMDEAATGIARVISKFFPTPGCCVVFGGKGNNAGDAFAAATILRARGWKVEIRLAYSKKDFGKLAQKKFLPLMPGKSQASFCGNARPLIVLDGLLGLGAKPLLRGPIRTACREINQLRREQNAFVFAVDLPTGLEGDSGATDADCVRADCTITVGFAKRGLLADAALKFVGRLEVVSLGELSVKDGEAIVATPAALHALLPRRNFGAYKNQFGRVGVVAGSEGFTGAAILCSLGALRAGAGLVELFVPAEIYPVVAAGAAPEVMVKPVSSYKRLLDQPIDVWAVGPGLGRKHPAELLKLIEKAEQPMVIDADGLNLLAGKISVLHKAKGFRLLTPHPGEMNRLSPWQTGSRAEIADRFCAKHPVTLLLKGSRTIVAEAGRPQSYNTTGNPGMATGGMGDVLTGVCAALIAQKLSPYDAARLGAWICGRAAEIAIFENRASEESLLPSDLIEHLGGAFNDLRAGPFTL